jgi:hypothetical protein
MFRLFPTYMLLTAITTYTRNGKTPTCPPNLKKIISLISYDVLCLIKFKIVLGFGKNISGTKVRVKYSFLIPSIGDFLIRINLASEKNS